MEELSKSLKIVNLFNMDDGQIMFSVLAPKNFPIENLQGFYDCDIEGNRIFEDSLRYINYLESVGLSVPETEEFVF